MKRLVLGVILLLWSYCCTCKALPAEWQLGADSLFLRHLCDTVMGKLDESDRQMLFNRLLNESRKRRNTYYEGTALFLLAKHYYGGEVDSMVYYMQQALPLLYKQNRLEELFRMKAWYVYALTRGKNNKAALDSINSLKRLALDLDYPDGIDMANQALADYYLSNDLKQEGLALYEDILAGMEKKDVPLVKRINIIRQLLNKAPGQEKKLEYLGLLKKYLDQCDRDGIVKLDDENRVSTLKYTMNRGFAMTYLHLGKNDLALRYLKQAEALLKEYNIANRQLEIKTIYAVYYWNIGELDKSIALYDELLQCYEHLDRTSTYINLLNSKGNLLVEARRFQEAAEVFRLYAIKKDSLSTANYYRELANMRTRHNIDKLELANRKLEVEALRDRTRMFYLWTGVIALVFVCCLLFFLVYLHRRHSMQLRKAKEKAEESDRLKSAFLANMNHEIRTPLNAIVGFSQVLIDEEDQEARRQFADIIQSNNDLLQRLISDVLDISKIESNTISLHYAEYDLPVLMSEIYNIILLRMNEGVELQLADCPPCMLYIDRNRLTQVLTNLLTNAIKHTKAGFIRFGYEAAESEVCFFVQDTGEGIPEEQQEQVFSRFVQLDDWNKGVGLGLAICKGLLEKMNGSIRVTSKVGEGSVFYVKLPRV